jgi:hypothetical protein
MFELTTADIIWNRACLQDVMGLGVGDQALAAMILAHGLVMNGGVLHAVESLDPGQLVAVQEGFRYFGLARVEAFLAEAKSTAEAGGDRAAREAAFDKRYAALVPDDSFLIERFESVLRRSPSAFAPPLP